MLSFSPDRVVSTRVSLPVDREGLARQLSFEAGVHPDALLPNTLDEEPQDGALPGGTPGHFAWREMLMHADRIVSGSRVQ